MQDRKRPEKRGYEETRDPWKEEERLYLKRQRLLDQRKHAGGLMDLVGLLFLAGDWIFKNFRYICRR